MGDVARPIFVVGSPRSGTSILTWSLGQHPNILPLEETTWLAKLALALGPVYDSGAARGERSQLSSARISSEDFFRSFGDAADQLIRRAERQRPQPEDNQELKLRRSPLDPKERWVDGAPENSFYIFGLLKLFPQAQFIHILRDVGSVVKSLMNFVNLGVPNYSEQAALLEWIRKVRVCVEAERALGSDIFLRVRHAELVKSPEAVIRRCLDFLKEPFCSDCLKPLKMKINSSQAAADFNPYDPATDARLREDAVRLSQELLEEGCPRYQPEPGETFLLDEDFALKSGRRYPELVRRVQEIVQATLPAGATVLVVSKGDAGLLELDGRKAWHFPQDETGAYAGYYPADSTAAIAQLAALRAKGADFLLFPCTAFWWLEHYCQFHQYLETRCRRIRADEYCVIYQLPQSAI